MTLPLDVLANKSAERMRTFSKVFLPIAVFITMYFGSYFLMVHRGYGDMQCGY